MTQKGVPFIRLLTFLCAVRASVFVPARVYFRPYGLMSTYELTSTNQKKEMHHMVLQLLTLNIQTLQEEYPCALASRIYARNITNLSLIHI